MTAQFVSTLKKISVPQTFSSVGMTAASVGGTIDSIGPIPYASALALGVFNLISPAQTDNKNAILKQIRKPETASHIMMLGAAYNTIENGYNSIVTSGNATHIALTAYWALASLAHYRMGELQSQNNQRQTQPRTTLEAISKNPANIFIPMNLILASIPLAMNGSLPTTVTSLISLVCTAAAAYHVAKKTGQHVRGEIKANDINDGIANKFNMGVCSANAAGFIFTAIETQSSSALAMGVASLAFVGTNWRLLGILKAQAKPI